MKVIPFKRKTQELGAVDKSLNLTNVCHQKIEQIESVLNSEETQEAEFCASELKRINASLDLILRRVKVQDKYKKVV
jgi:hypothetical protein